MLKIKDNVDLKELEKYGFYETEYTYIKNGELQEATSVHKDTKTIYPTYDSGYTFYVSSDILYDLIKDGLVEKVED